MMEEKTSNNQDLLNTAPETKPEVVNVVEKVSGILSPYFIVVVGLFLYEDNFLIGIILIAIGILSLLRVSGKDISSAIANLKNFLGLSEEK